MEEGLGRSKAGPVSAYLPEMAQSDRRNNLFTLVGATFRSIVCLSMYLGLRLRAAGPFEVSVYRRPPVTGNKVEEYPCAAAVSLI